MKFLKLITSATLFTVLLMPFFASAASDGQIKVKMPSSEARKGAAMMQIRQQEAAIEGEDKKVVPALNIRQGSDATKTKAGLGNQNIKKLKAGASEGDRIIQRRSRVANAVQGMLEVAGRNKGVGERVSIIAQAQGQNQESIEGQLKEVKNRGRLKKFFFGPDYKKINSAEEKILNHEEKIEELKQLASEVTNEDDVVKLETQIGVMEEIKVELKKELSKESKGFSLFGWLNRMMAK